MATSRPFAYNSSQGTIYCADNFSTLSVGAFSTDFSSKPGGLTWWMGPDEDTGYIIAIPVPAGNMPSPIGNTATVKFFVTTAKNDSEFITLSKIVTGQTFANAAAARTYLVSNGYWTNYLDADAQTFITSAAITDAAQKMAINNLVTNLKLQNLWTKMTAVYPIIGGNATAHSKNLKSPSTYPISFSSGWTHTSEGMQAVTPISAAYADTGIPIGASATEDNHISVYCATDSRVNSGSILMGVWDGYDSDGSVTTYQINISLTGTNGYVNTYDYWYNSGPDLPITPFFNTSFGHFINTTTGSKTSLKAYVNGSLNNTATGTVGTATSLSLLIGNTYYLGGVTNTNYTGIISFATAGSSLTDTDALNLSTTIEKFQNALSRGKAPVLAYDPDLTNFLLRIYAAGGTVSRNELIALASLVSYLKNNGLWTRLSAVYPMVGGTSASCAQNLTSSSFTGTFSSGWTFSYQGVTPNGTSAYMNTGFNFLDHGIDNNNGAFGIYLNTSRASNNGAHGQISIFSPSSYIYPFTSGYMVGGINSTWLNSQAISTDSLGMFQTSRSSSTQEVLYKNETGTTFNLNTTSRNNSNLYLGAININGSADVFDNTRIASAYVTKYGLTSTELTNMYTGLQAFNSTLARVAGKPSFSDPDSQSFIDRVYAAGGTVTAIEAAAVNLLVLELKNKGLWTKMKALYPFIGSSSASASQNLISSSYTGTFVGSWNYGSGVTSTGGHFNTGFVPGTQSSVNGFSFGARWVDYQYDPTQTQTIGVNFVSNSTTLLLNTSAGGFNKVLTMGGSAQLFFYPVYGTYGSYIFRRTSSTFAQAYVDGPNTGTLTSYGTITTDIGSSLPNSSFFFGRYNLNGAASGNYVKSRQRWGFLGLDLTDQQAKDLNTALYNFGLLI